MRRMIIFDYLVTQNSIFNANKLAWPDERKDDLYTQGRPNKARMATSFKK
jgi:hypothetical protein